jgi:transposase
VRVVDVLVDELNLKDLGVEGAEPELIGRPAYHPGTLLKIYIYGYVSSIQSVRLRLLTQHKRRTRRVLMSLAL